MSVKITKVTREDFPALRFIGRKYGANDNFGAKWGEWWSNDLFTLLDKLGGHSVNGDAYIGAKRIVDGMLEYWIGMFFAPGTEVPEGYEFVDMDAINYAVFWVYGRENEVATFDAHNLCLSELSKHGMVRREDDWCFERYNCPRYTTPDEAGNVILDYGISII